jgi:serine protein kinase
MSILNKIGNYNTAGAVEEITLEEYLKRAKEDSSLYLTAAERMLRAIGEPEIVDTSKDKHLSRVFSNKLIKKYKVFEDFYGMEDSIERIVSFFTHAAQGLEESKQILYLLGPVGGGKSSLAEKLKELMSTQPIFAIKDSPIFESPLGLFSPKDSKALGIPGRYLTARISPWLTKRLDELGGDLSKLKVVKIYPNQARRIAIAKTEPGDDNNQDISTLVGKLNIRKLEEFDPNDPDAYSYSGGLCRGNRGALEFVEMFKAPIKMLHPLLTATQEKNYNGTQEIGSIPFDGLIIAHSNESEWQTFKNDKKNEAFIDRVFIVDVPYCLRASEEEKILKKLINNSTLADAPVAPGTFKMLAEFNVMTRIEKPETAKSSLFTKMEVYDGREVKSKDSHAKSIIEYKDLIAKPEGFYGFSTRLAYKVLASTFNRDIDEIAANPIHLKLCLQDQIEKERYGHDRTVYYLAILDLLQNKYLEELEKDIQESYLDSASEYGQNLFERYALYADHWIQDEDFRDPETGEMYNRESLNSELEKIEKPAGIANPKDFRNEITQFFLRYSAKNGGKKPAWNSYNPIKEVIEKNIFSHTSDLLPIISFSGHANKDDQKKHDQFVSNMKKKGYTGKQIKILVNVHEKFKKQ